MMPRVLFGGLALLGLLACGADADGSAAGQSGRAAAGRPGGSPSAGGAPGGRPAPAVEVVAARMQAVEDVIAGVGEVEAIQSILLRPEVEGRIVEILFREGTLVARGTELFRVDDAELRAQVTRAEADRDLAIQSLNRQRQLMESQSSTTSDLERAEATARSSQAALDLLKLRLDRTVVRAPFAGVVGARLVSLGDFVNNQTRLVSLQTVDPQRVTMSVPERYAEQLRTGLRVTFQVAALRGRTFTGTVDFVDPVVRLPGRTILLKAVVPNPRRELQAGMFAEGRLVAAARPNAVVIPEEAILPVQGNTLVYVVQDGKAVRRSVETGVRTPGFVEITGGITAGELVVVGGVERLTDGITVRAVVR
jgi:membrane fusion protein (multidrug efflux system)